MIPATTAAVAAAAVIAGTAAGLLFWAAGTAGVDSDPVAGLSKLDLLYLDEPAPGYTDLGFQAGRPGLLLVCGACAAPDVDVQIVRTTDPQVATAYALTTADGRVGPGYALIDGRGRVRYRTFDADPARHRDEVAVLVGALE